LIRSGTPDVLISVKYIAGSKLHFEQTRK
jgi:hypothetical protein